MDLNHWGLPAAGASAPGASVAREQGRGRQVPVVVAEWLRRWTRTIGVSPPQVRILPTTLFASPPARRGEVAVLFCTPSHASAPLHRTNTPLDLFADRASGTP
ncbi:hypothetical protein G5714_024562 [Onychostoma macrolepis]|uniref:Uncharacterized protein n=1 Tax=Onychostoma macrolepis TaxID=369639 RepID=A0A7J6BJS1_9TELE|nr:hypothetical protein G5714_024562 [Onychostoma macrolepis]